MKKEIDINAASKIIDVKIPRQALFLIKGYEANCIVNCGPDA